MKPCALILLICSCFFTNAIHAQFCSADSSFGKNGMEVLKKAASSELTASSAIQKDGKIVVAVTIYDPNDAVHIFIVRYNTDGTLDKSFATDGKILASVNSNRAYAEAVTILPDGKILVAGYSYQAHAVFSSYDFTILRYNTNGSADSSFGNNGIVLTDFKDGSENEHAAEIALQADGKFIVAGTSRDYGEAQGIYRTRFICARYNADGDLDLGFGDNGKTRFYFDADAYDEEAEAKSVAIDSKGRIIIAGYNASYTGGIDAAIARCNPDGSPDLTFGNEGKILTNITGSGLYMQSVLIQQDHKILLGGSITGTGPAAEKAILFRYNENGSIDETFGTNGIVMNNTGNTQNNCHSIALQPNGKIIAAGSSGNAFYVSRYNMNGSLDNSFGGNGHIMVQVASAGSSYVEKVNLYNNKIILAGFAYWNGDADIAIARFNNDLLLATTQLNFTVAKKDNTALLKWQTKNESNNSYFAVQRSTDGNHFTETGIVKSKGSSSNLQEYNFTDANPKAGINYYRLKQVNADGSFTYSSIATVAFEKTITIKISPNPVQNILTVNGITTAKDLAIINAEGKIVSTKYSVSNNCSFNMQGFAAGIYFLLVQENGKRLATIKFVKNN